MFKFEKVVFEATFDGVLFKIPETSDSVFNTFDFWHQALGHLSASSIEKARKFDDDAQIIPKKPDNFHCEPCTTSKLTCSPQRSSNRRASNKFDLIHTDLSGPWPVSFYGGSLYYITFIDDATRCSWIRFMKHKSETNQVIQNFVREMELHYGTKIKAFRSDNDGKYIDGDL